MTARFAEEISQADLWETAMRYHLAGIGAHLCPRVPFSECDSPPCQRFRGAGAAPGETRA